MSPTTDYDGPIERNHQRAIEDATAGREFGVWIDGGSAPAAGGGTFAVRDPAVVRPIVDVARGADADVSRAVEAARAAFERDWRDRTATERADLLREWVDRMRDHLDELALLECLEVGKPLSHARADVENGFDFFEYYAGVAVAGEGEHVPTGGDTHAYVRREPYGVAGAILPWNYPILLAAWKVGAALAAGNATVVKPSERAPLSVVRAARLSEGILPDGVLNVVPGYGEEAGAALADNPSVDKLSFTGSVPVGQGIMRAAAETVAPVTLELGGKNPFVVFPDADLESAAASAAVGGLYNAGQSCDAASRLIVHESVKDEFVDRLLDEYEGYDPGDPLAGGTSLGALCFEGQYETVEEYVDLGTSEGATVLAGGRAPGGDLADGLFYEPTLFADADPSMRLAREEIFGPVQAVLTYETYEEAIEIANGVDYGLVAAVATSDASLGHRAAADIQAGSVWVNQYFGTVPGTPFGGFKRSGIGRECAAETLREHTQSKVVSVVLEHPDL